MKIDVKPMSVNAAYRGRRYKSNLYKAYEEEVLLKLPPMEVPEGNLEITIQAGFSNKNSDLDNCCKPFVDILQKKYGFNDNRIYAITMLKRIVPKGSEYISFSIFECLKDDE